MFSQISLLLDLCGVSRVRVFYPMSPSARLDCGPGDKSVSFLPKLYSELKYSQHC